jgi:hypothetical protein
MTNAEGDRLPVEGDRIPAEGERFPSEVDCAGLVVFVKSSGFCRRRQVSLEGDK